MRRAEHAGVFVLVGARLEQQQIESSTAAGVQVAARPAHLVLGHWLVLRWVLLPEVRRHLVGGLLVAVWLRWAAAFEALLVRTHDLLCGF